MSDVVRSIVQTGEASTSPWGKWLSQAGSCRDGRGVQSSDAVYNLPGVDAWCQRGVNAGSVKWWCTSRQDINLFMGSWGQKGWIAP